MSEIKKNEKRTKSWMGHYLQIHFSETKSSTSAMLIKVLKYILTWSLMASTYTAHTNLLVYLNLALLPRLCTNHSHHSPTFTCFFHLDHILIWASERLYVLSVPSPPSENGYRRTGLPLLPYLIVINTSVKITPS